MFAVLGLVCPLNLNALEPRSPAVRDGLLTRGSEAEGLACRRVGPAERVEPEAEHRRLRPEGVGRTPARQELQPHPAWFKRCLEIDTRRPCIRTRRSRAG